MAQYQALPLPALTELDLRLFLYEWLPRKVAMGWRDAKKVPGGLRLFLQFLAEVEAIACPWAEDVLAGEEAYADRWESCPGHFWWDDGMAEWRAEAYADLDRRMMLHGGELGEDDNWGNEMGIEEARLERLLGRSWLLWRDEAIRAGTTDPTTVRLRLTRQQREWEREARSDLGGRSPIQVIGDERKQRARRRR
jgi:hypothetical protein